MSICTINGCTVAPENIERVRTVLIAYAEDVRTHEPGCRSIRLHQDQEIPGHFVVLSEFDDQAAYDEHLISAHVARLRKTLELVMGDSHHKTVLRPIE